jgi:HAMP domain-containing protein/signal transduction histidine kinase/DNA-binding response OmpR family regulator
MEISARGRTLATRRRSAPAVKSKLARTNGNGNGGHAETTDADLKKLLRALQAVRDGDFSVRLAPDLTGLAGKIADTFNEMVGANERMAKELERVGQMVGKEGKTRIRVANERRGGAWGEMESSVNTLIEDLLWPTTEVTRTITAVGKGDLTQAMRLEADGRPLKGEFLRSANVVNEMIAQMGVFTSEVTRVAREVGTEGKLGGQAQVRGASGVWRDLTDNVNSMAANLTGQVRNIAEVTTAVANGDLSRKITADVRGEILQLKETINTMVDQLRSFASEVTRVAREVGTEGKLGGQAIVPGVAGTWKDLTDNVNSMAANLTGQVRNIAEVTIAVASGDLSRKITVDVRGEILQLKETINTMVDQLRSFASEVTRVAREVGTEGKLGGQAIVPGVAGTWKDLTDNVNSMAANLTGQVRNIAEVTTAVATGDLSRKITVDTSGEILRLKEAINTMVDQLRSFASEVTRVAREVGTEGKLGGQAEVQGVSGVWKDLTDNVNSMASNLTNQVRNIAEVTTAVARGDLSRKITVDVRGEILLLKETINTMVDQLNGFAAEVTRVAREVGTEGNLGGQAQVPGVAGTWKDLTDSVNAMATNLTGQVRNIAEVTTAVARGDLSRKITVEVRGEILQLKETINTMVDQLNSFAAEVTRVAREVGTEGKLGGQANVRDVSGVWKELTENVNVMANNLTEQVRGIVKVVTAVANGDLRQRLTVESKGEVAALGETINSMTTTLAIFAEQVTSVAREVGVEGRLGGQAHVAGASGTWKDLVANVNMLAANLTTQVRAIAEVATAVTKGDLTRSIQVEARGEVSELKDNINAMIHNLRHTTERNTEQDWLKTNLAKFSRMMQGQRDLVTLGNTLLAEFAPLVNAHQGVIYSVDYEEGQRYLKQLASYADVRTTVQPRRFRFGEGFVGECAVQRQRLLLARIPQDSIRMASGLVEATPRNVIVLPVLYEGEIKAVIELASMYEFTASQLAFLEQLTGSIGVVLNTIEATMRTEGLLKQSQELASELQIQQVELQTANEDLGTKARLLADQNAEVERKNNEIELARKALEEKAAELALTSRYKTEFLANMSHELRTPLNSILILGQQLSENPESNLSARQVEFAKTIHAAGTDLLNLISDILDLSKIESGTVTVESEELAFSQLRETIERNFRHEAESRHLTFTTDFDPRLGRNMVTDAKRLMQIVKNLLSNAMKFTAQGSVRLHVGQAMLGWTADHPVLSQANMVVEFSVTDTGIGISPEKQKIIFEAFQQADAGTARKYGGTGLGLAISRELAHLLGGEIRLKSAPGQGSTFTLYLPLNYQGAAYGRGGAPYVKHQPSLTAPTLPPAPVERVEDDRDAIEPGDRTVLVVEDDVTYAKMLIEVARKQGFKALVAQNGTDALSLARKYQPNAVTLDVFLPDMLGWTVLNQLKHDPATRHIPVQVLTVEEERQYGLERGAFSFMTKPNTKQGLEHVFDRIREFIAPRVRELLVVEDDAAERLSIEALIAGSDIQISSASSGGEALDLMREKKFDCVVLDLKLPDISGFDLLSEVQRDERLRDIPIVVFTGRELSQDEEGELRQRAKSIVLKGVQSPERLLDETALFLHRVISDLPESKQKLIEKLHDSDEPLRDRKVIVVDDDVRNIFALNSLLERHGMNVITATNGQDAIKLLDDHPDVSLILTDVMMPEMDGYETMRRIREIPSFRMLPIIALTAKAMKGDREKCLQAGASDYVAKPVNTEQLLSLVRMWLQP